jgi:hypothetical protein
MSFWSDASAVTKGAIVVAVLALLYMGVAYAAGLPPFVKIEATQERGPDGPRIGPCDGFWPILATQVAGVGLII